MAVRFDGSNQYLSIGSPPGFTTAYTIAGWVRLASLPSTGNAGTFFSHINSWPNVHAVQYYNPSGTTLFYPTLGGSSGGSQSVSTNTWYHLAWVSEPSVSGRLYVDGALSDTRAWSILTSPASLYFNVWSNNDSPGNQRMAQVKIWQRALTVDQIAVEMRVARPVDTASLWAWYPLSHSTDLADYSGNGRTLSSSGSPTTEDGPPVSWGANVWVLPYVVSAPSGPTYTITADAGSYALTGQASALKVGRKVSAAVGTFALTGQAVNVRRGYTLTASAGAYALTGNATGVRVGRKVTAALGTFALTGNATGVRIARWLSAVLGSYALTGSAADLVYTPNSGPTYTLSAAVGTYTLTGQATGLYRGYALTASAVSFVLTGNAAGLIAHRRIVASGGSYALTGNAAILRTARRLGATVGSYTLAGVAVNLVYTPDGGPTYTLPASAGSYALAGQAAALLAGRKMAATPASYALTAQVAGLYRGYVLTGEPGAYTLTGQAVAILIARMMTARRGNFTLSGAGVALTYSGAEPTIIPDSRVYVVGLDNRGYSVAFDNRTYTVGG